MIDEVSAALATIGGRAEFAFEEPFPTQHLGLRVQGVGRLALPVTDAWARKLAALGRPAPFGFRDETRFDEHVRSGREIGAERVALDDGFAQALAPTLDAVRRRLGLPRGGTLRAVLDKLLVYGPGQFFAPHQDSERLDGMLATLVLVLPSKHTGGAIVVTHDGEQRKLGALSSRSAATLVAFYADCRHEIEPVASGHRIALTFHLVHEGAAEAPSRAGPVDRLAGVVEDYFATPLRRSYSTEETMPPDRLVYLLDHEYTQRGLGWKHLKGKDRLRVRALLAVADRLDCEAFLALADVHEQWTCEDGPYDRRRRYDDEDDDDADEAAEGGELDELLDTDGELRHFVGRDGKPAPGIPSQIDERELCSTCRTVDFDPFRSEHEGWMGNYGNTVDRWYHRAALVLWPRARTFVLRAKLSPVWAVDEISRLLTKGCTDDARRQARSLVPFWRDRAAEQQGAAFFQKLLKVTVALGDAPLALDLLSPFGPGRLTAGAMPALRRAVERFGLDWSKSLFEAWTRREQHGESALLPVLVRLCRSLSVAGSAPGGPLASWLFSRELAGFRKRCATARVSLGRRHGAEVRKWIVRDATELLESAAALEEQAGADELVAFLTGADTVLPPPVLGEVVAAYRGTEIRAALRPGLRALRAHVVETVRAELAKPTRASDDWSITPPDGCLCELCRKLGSFLRDPRAVELPWPLAKEKRSHVHGIIDVHELPVEHTTMRSGSPFTLRLRKTRALFEREAASRAEQAALLRRIERGS